MTAPRYTENWYLDEQIAALTTLARTTLPLAGCGLEIGAWQGRSTIPLAAALAPKVLHVVDHFRGNPEAPHTVEAAQQRDIRGDFERNVEAAGVANVQLFVKDWREYAQGHAGWRYCFVHLDGPHTEAEVRDQCRWFWPRLLPGGVLAGDDWQAWPGVRAGVLAAGLRPASAGNLWWLRKPQEGTR